MGFLWKEWFWSSSTLATSCEELTHWKRLWCWEGLRAGEGDDRGWDSWMASLTWWTWVWVNSGSWWWTGRPGVLLFLGSQRVGHNWATELNWIELTCLLRNLYAVQETTVRTGHGTTDWFQTEKGVHQGCILSPCSFNLCAEFQLSSVSQSCWTLCDPMNRSTPGLPVHHQLPEFTQTPVHWVSDAIQPSHPLLSPSPPALNLSQHQGLFKWVSSSHQVAKILELQF